MHCEVCGREVRGDIDVADGELPDGTWLVLLTSTPDRDWILCDGCNKLVCHDCSEHPKTGYCDSCLAKQHLFDEELFAAGSPSQDYPQPLQTGMAAEGTTANGDRFTQAEAEAKVGKTVRSLAQFSGVPKGTTGRVVAADDLGQGFDAVIEWNIPQPPPSALETEIAGTPVTIINAGQPLRDWFTKEEYQKYLEEL
jgi:hypothetical protein